MHTAVTTKKRSALTVIFTTVFLDLVGFGIIIPLVGIYGRHYEATPIQLAALGSIYSIMQFIFSPIWGGLSDRVGRRPILLMSLLGSTFSYLLFGFAESFSLLILSRALAGIFAANVSTAQAYIADVTEPKDRAKGMGLIGAAFGLGFMLGPPIGGISVAQLGLAGPGWVAATLCGLNFILAFFRLKESLPVAARTSQIARRPSRWTQLQQIPKLWSRPELRLPILSSFVTVFAFSNVEQVFSLLIQSQFSLGTEEAGLKTGWVLMWSGVLGALIQGGWIRKLVPRHGEVKIFTLGLFIQGFAMAVFSHSPTYFFYFVVAVPLAIGSGFIHPTLNAIVSQKANENEQGLVIGVKEGLSSLGRVFGPFCGILLFTYSPHLPFYIAAFCTLALGFYWVRHKSF